MRDVGDRDGDDESAGVFRIGIRLGIDCVVMILGVGRIDGDERKLAPVLAARKPGGSRLLGFGQCLAAKHVRDFVRVDRDEADRPLGLERAEPLLHLRGLQAEAALAREFDRHQIAVLGVGGRARRDGEFAAELLLVDRLDPRAAVRQRAEDAELALPRAVQHLDDTAGVADRFAFLAALLGAQQRAVADAGDFHGARLARNADADVRRVAVRLGVPLGRHGDQFAVAVAVRDVGEHDRGQRAGVMQLLAPRLDRSLVFEAAQHLAERRAVGVLQAEGACDLAHAGLAFMRADEGNDIVAGGKAGGLGSGLFQDD